MKTQKEIDKFKKEIKEIADQYSETKRLVVIKILEAQACLKENVPANGRTLSIRSNPFTLTIVENVRKIWFPSLNKSQMINAILNDWAKKWDVKK
jgi:hypothetical protein